jgi:hypothetical protein
VRAAKQRRAAGNEVAGGGATHRRARTRAPGHGSTHGRHLRAARESAK